MSSMTSERAQFLITPPQSRKPVGNHAVSEPCVILYLFISKKNNKWQTQMLNKKEKNTKNKSYTDDDNYKI